MVHRFKVFGCGYAAMCYLDIILMSVRNFNKPR